MTGTLCDRLFLDVVNLTTQDQEEAKPEQEPGLQPDRNAEPSRSCNTFTNVHAGDDSRQLIVSTTGLVIHAADVSTGARTIHGMGQMSDGSIQYLFKPVNQPTAGQEVQRTQQEMAAWQKQYGKGHNIP